MSFPAIARTCHTPLPTDATTLRELRILTTGTAIVRVDTAVTYREYRATAGPAGITLAPVPGTAFVKSHAVRDALLDPATIARLLRAYATRVPGAGPRTELYAAVYTQLPLELRATALAILAAGFDDTPAQLLASTHHAHAPACP